MEVRQPGRAAAGLGTFSGEDRGLMAAGRPDFRWLRQSGLFAPAAAAFGALCTLKLDSTRCGVNLG